MEPTKTRKRRRSKRVMFTEELGAVAGAAPHPYSINGDFAYLATSLHSYARVRISTGGFTLAQPFAWLPLGGYYVASVNGHQFDGLPDRLKAVVKGKKVSLHRLIRGNKKPVFSPSGEPLDVHHVNQCKADCVDENLLDLPPLQHHQLDSDEPATLGPMPKELADNIARWIAAGGSFSGEANSSREAKAAAREYNEACKQKTEQIVTEYIYRWWLNEFSDVSKEDKYIAYRAGTLYAACSFEKFVPVLKRLKIKEAAHARLVAKCMRKLFGLRTVPRTTANRSTQNVYVFTSSVKPVRPLPLYLVESNIGTECKRLDPFALPWLD